MFKSRMVLRYVLFVGRDTVFFFVRVGIIMAYVELGTCWPGQRAVLRWLSHILGKGMVPISNVTSQFKVCLIF
jgi:hypothetical protein